MTLLEESKVITPNPYKQRGTFKVHHIQNQLDFIPLIYTDNKRKLSVYPYMRMVVSHLHVKVS